MVVVSVCKHIYVPMHACVCGCMRVRVCARMSAHTRASACVRARACACMCVYVDVGEAWATAWAQTWVEGCCEVRPLDTDGRNIALMVQPLLPR